MGLNACVLPGPRYDQFIPPKNVAIFGHFESKKFKIHEESEGFFSFLCIFFNLAFFMFSNKFKGGGRGGGGAVQATSTSFTKSCWRWRSGWTKHGAGSGRPSTSGRRLPPGCGAWRRSWPRSGPARSGCRRTRRLPAHPLPVAASPRASPVWSNLIWDEASF